MSLVLNKDDLFRYLQGEITLEEWDQGKQLLEIFSGDDAKEPTPQIVVGEAGTSQSVNAPSTSDKGEPSQEAQSGGESEEEEEGEEDFDRRGDDGSQSIMQDEEAGTSAMEEDYRQHRKGVDASTIEIELEKEEWREGRRRRKRRGRGGGGGGRRLVPKPLRGLMGEAHLCFARGLYDEAITMCSEIIKQAPKCPDPFQLLGMIYEDKGQAEKSLQFSLIAAHLNPRDIEEWVKLAETCLEQNNIKTALHCYSKALKADPKNVSLLWEKASLYDQLQDHKRAMECYHTLLKVLPPEKAQESLQLARDMVKTCHQSGDIQTAIQILETTIAKHPDTISSEDVNMLAELHISSRQYQRALQVICDHCDISIKTKGQSATSALQGLSLDSSKRSSHLDADDLEVTVPGPIPIDLRVKLGVCLIHGRHLPAAKRVLTQLLGESPEEMGDLYLDVAEAYVEIGQNKEAKPILGALVKTSNYNLPAVWLRYAECLNNLGALKQANGAYRKVLEQVPSHLDARLALATVEKQMGNADEALNVLSMVEEGSEILGSQDVNLIYQRCMLQHSQGYLKEFAKTGYIMMTQYLRMNVNDTSEEKQPEIIMSGDVTILRADDWYNLFIKTCEALVATKQFDKAAELGIRVMKTNLKDRNKQPITNDPLKKERLEFLAINCCFLSGQYIDAFNFMKIYLSRSDGTSVAGWNLFNLITNHTIDIRHHKFCLRLTVRKFPDVFALCVLNGHNAFMSGSFKHALGEYVRGYRISPKDPIVNFCIGLCMIHIACQKYSMKKHSLIIQGFSFLKRYQEFRGSSQEVSYNLGRALHQLGLYHLAIHFYQQALDTPPSIPGDPRFDLSRDIAYNLSLIYQHSGNNEMAMQLLYQHIVV